MPSTTPPSPPSPQVPLDPGALEAMDGASAAALVEALGPTDADLLGVRARRIGSVVAVRANRLDVLQLNRIIGLGVGSPATPDLVDDLIAWYRAARVPRFFVQLAPGAAPEDLRDQLARRGLAHYNNWAKLWRSTEQQPTIVTDLRVERVGAGRSHEFAAIACRAFGLPDAARSWLAALVGRPAWRHYLALDGEAPVAAGALFIQGQIGWVGFAATDASHRGRGAQSALLARRIADARQLGISHLVAETAEDACGSRAPSFHNLRRLGFELAYLRPNYLWKAAPVAA